MKVKFSKYVYNTFILSIFIFLIEIIFKIANNQTIFSISSIRILFSSIIFGLIFSYLELFIKDKYIPKVNIFIIGLVSIYSILQLGFNNFIGVYISFNVSSQAGAVFSYIFDFFKSFYWYYYLILIPFVLLIVYYELLYRKKITVEINKENNKLKNSFILTSFLLVFGFLYYVSISLDVFQNKLQTISNKDLFLNPSNPSIAIKEFGTTTYAILDIKNVFNPNLEMIESKPTYNQDDKTKDNDKKWLKVIEEEEDLVLNYLNYYYINNEITTKNEYTGLFKDKNLIVIMLESVNDIIINKDLYPNFYKLYSEGFYFKNHYSPRNSCATGNNELSGMIGLYSIYNKCTANAYSSNLYPESIFNLFNNKGYITTSMHDYTEKYYERREIHKNMGSTRYFDVDDLKLEYNTKDEEWASDEDFMIKVVEHLENYKDNDKFMTWLTTVTPHQPYGKSVFGDKYLHLFENNKYEDYNTKLKRYMSKLKVLDDGLGVLINGLREQGKLEDTVIVMYGDHYPYGLSNGILEDAIPYSIEEKYENERVPFVIWSNDIEAKTYTEYTSYVNILPTIANLFDLYFEPRYYAGADLFSKEYESIVIFADGSWKNEYAFYDASTSDITYYKDKEYSLEELIVINQKVADKIKYSNLAIQHNYFNYLDEALKNKSE